MAFFFKKYTKEFPDGLVIRIPGFHCLVQRTEIPQAAWCGKKKIKIKKVH